ncbi:MAG: SDR family NAD(P)-dependent oxidoreductase [Fidelibacterota bacterium]
MIDDRPILVTGGAGFIGSHLIDSLLARGQTVICLDNLNDFYAPEIKRLNQAQHKDYQTYHFYEGDIRDRAFVEKVFQAWEVGTVIHLAALAGVRPSLQQPTLYSEVNILGTQNILEAAARNKVAQFVFASSSSVYGNNEKIPFSETDNVDQQISPYGATKKMGEVLCYTYHHLYQLPMICLRFFTVYGPRQRPEMAIHKFVRIMFNGDPVPLFGDGSTARDYTYIDDIIAGIIKALEVKEGYTIYNLGNSEPVKLKDLVDVIGGILGVTPRLDFQPLPKGDVQRTYADITRARQQLDYEPKTHLHDGIISFVDWYREMKAKFSEWF